MRSRAVTTLIADLHFEAAKLQHNHGVLVSHTLAKAIMESGVGETLDKFDFDSPEGYMTRLIDIYDLDRWDKLPHDSTRCRDILKMLKAGKKVDWCRRELKKYGITE